MPGGAGGGRLAGTASSRRRIVSALRQLCNRADARIHMSCAVVVAPTLDRALARWVSPSSATGRAGGQHPSRIRRPGIRDDRDLAVRGAFGKPDDAVASCAADQVPATGACRPWRPCNRGSAGYWSSQSSRPDQIILGAGGGSGLSQPRDTSPGRCVGIGGSSPSGGAISCPTHEHVRRGQRVKLVSPRCPACATSLGTGRKYALWRSRATSPPKDPTTQPGVARHGAWASAALLDPCDAHRRG